MEEKEEEVEETREAINSLKERFLLDCRKTNSKVINLAKQIRSRQSNAVNQSELVANTCSQRQARENEWEQVTIDFGLTFTSTVKNQSNSEI